MICHCVVSPIDLASVALQEVMDKQNLRVVISKLFVVGVKRTCKDRWRQVLREAPRVDRKHLLTIQNGISATQMEEIKQAGVELIVPRNLHSFFPRSKRSQLQTLDGFVDDVRRALAQ